MWAYDGAENSTLRNATLRIRNKPPTQDTPILNSTYGTNYTDEDLHCYNQSFSDADNDVLTVLYK